MEMIDTERGISPAEVSLVLSLMLSIFDCFLFVRLDWPGRDIDIYIGHVIYLKDLT